MTAPTLFRRFGALVALLLVFLTAGPAFAKVLFVDDDGGTSGETTWTAALDSLGVEYDAETIATNGHPVAALEDYDIVIWSIGDRAYTNLTSQNVAALKTYLDNGGNLLYAGGHCLYSEPVASGFVGSHLGLKDWTYNMPYYFNWGQAAIANGTGHAVAGNAEYRFHIWSGGHYQGSMFSAFGLLAPTAQSIMAFSQSNLGMNPGAPYAAAINDTGTFRAMTWGFDLNMLDEEFRVDLLGSALEGLGWQSNQAPVAVCADLTLEADAVCQATGSIDNGSYDPDGSEDIASLSISPAGPYALGQTLATLSIVDQAGASATCQATVQVIDVTPPTIACNAPATITPPGTPVSFTATTEDNCGATASVTGFSCWRINGAGKVIDLSGSCGVTLDGASLTLPKSNGVDTHIAWTVAATDAAGNITEQQCEVLVVIPGKAKGK